MQHGITKLSDNLEFIDCIKSFKRNENRQFEEEINPNQRCNKNRLNL